MRIAFVIINANQHEGTSRAVLEVATRLAARHQVALIARTNECTNPAIEWIKVPGVVWPEVADYYTFVLGSRKHLNDSFDIIHSAGPNCLAADVYAIQTVHKVKARLMNDVGANKNAFLHRKLTRWLYDKAVLKVEANAYKARNQRGLVGYLPVSNGTKEELFSSYALNNAMVEVIPNGVNPKVFSLENKNVYRSETRQEWNLSEDDFVLLFAGGDWTRKGLQIAIDAVAKITHRSVKLLVVGTDPLASSFFMKVKDAGLEERVIFAGFQKGVDRFYAAADLFVFPTAYEAFSLATIEAASSGLPVLMPDVSGARELLETGDAGVIVSRCPAAFAEAIERYFNKRRDLPAASLLATTYASREFNWDKVADRTEAFYMRLLDARKSMKS